MTEVDVFNGAGTVNWYGNVTPFATK
jgi:hypothetical protein